MLVHVEFVGADNAVEKFVASFSLQGDPGTEEYFIPLAGQLVDDF